ncbi:hypothetical protein BDP55DRAFT_629368 [Colletotrichum godetiae]|uniref:Uncharacterized protein n=1 Tax=Colletotrichum godetiae TaxID=1209918 RepID=A0AAJ0AR29_9PEZI|nr:uncharacterized protein BDP55DRAFT_629368 [Colletotrichum godetiae]KAK1688815.1 hypothetical protein BDP55DRAFT_629368 [Colletotrichum godetiae]
MAGWDKQHHRQQGSEATLPYMVSRQHTTYDMRQLKQHAAMRICVSRNVSGRNGRDRDGSPTMQHDCNSISSSRVQQPHGANWDSSILFLFVQPSTHARPIPSHRASALLHLINPKYGDRSAVSILRDVSIGKDAEDDSFDRPPVHPYLRAPVASLHRSQPPLHLRTPTSTSTQ